MRQNEALIDLIASLGAIEISPSIQLISGWNYNKNVPEVSLIIYLNTLIPDPGPYNDMSDEERMVNSRNYRKLKGMFGPFIENGEAPYIYLSSLTEVDIATGMYTVNVRVEGAFKCELIEEIDTPLTEKEINYNKQRAAQLQREADKLLTAETTTQKTWECSGKKTVVR